MMPATIAGPRDGRGDRKAFAGSRAKDTRDAKKTDPGHLKDSHLDTAKVFGDRQGHPTGHLRGIPAVDGYQGPTEIPAGADDERDFEAEAALAAKVTAEDAHAALALDRALEESVTQAETSDTVPRIDSLNSLIDSLNSLHKSGNDT